MKKILIIVLALLIAGELIFLLTPTASSTSADIETTAKKIVDKCQNSSSWQQCYEEEIPKLMNKPTNYSMLTAFDLTKRVQELDTQYKYCHVLGHKLSSNETKKDPEKWQSVVASCPSGVCSNGCIHGAFQERFRAESLPNAKVGELKSELENVCEARADWSPTGLEQGSCYHALGHLTMYITEADIDKAIELCDAVSKKSDGRDYSQLCYDGAFMQIYQPLEPDDFALIKGKEITSREQHKQFCSQFEPRAKSSCWSEGWPLYYPDIHTPEGLSSFCTGLPQNKAEEERCFLSLFYVVTPQMDFNIDRITSFCNGIAGTYKGQCFANAASRLIETDWKNIDSSVQICHNAQANNVGDSCYAELSFYAGYNFHPNSKEFVNLCNKLPEVWKERCLNGQSTKNN